MAKVTDLKRLYVIRALYSIKDSEGNTFFVPEELKDFKVEFGAENSKTGVGRVKVSAKVLTRSQYVVFSFYGFYHHICDYVDFKSVKIEGEFSVTLLISLQHEEDNSFKFNRLWLLEEEEEEGVDVAQDGVCPAVVEDNFVCSKSVAKHLL